jgi:DNA (cytosine-5)-methyltransferase 1
MRLLDLFCGAGGAAVGYHRAGFEVVGVDHKPQPHYPFEFHLADAMTYPLEGFEVIHASPPCQGYIQRNKNLATKHPKLIAPVRERLRGRVYVIENVEGAPLLHPFMLCGTMFGLALRRHRLFEADTFPLLVSPCNHWGTVAHGEFAGVYGRGGKGPRHGSGIREPGPVAGAPSWEEAMGIDWMTETEMTQAIPPAYTEYIGRALMAALKRKGE